MTGNMRVKWNKFDDMSIERNLPDKQEQGPCRSYTAVWSNLLAGVNLDVLEKQIILCHKYFSKMNKLCPSRLNMVKDQIFKTGCELIEMV